MMIKIFYIDFNCKRYVSTAEEEMKAFAKFMGHTMPVKSKSYAALVGEGVTVELL